MKDLVNKFIANIHILIFGYGIYSGYLLYEAHSVQVEEINNQIPNIEQQIELNQKKVREISDFVKKSAEYKLRVE